MVVKFLTTVALLALAFTYGRAEEIDLIQVKKAERTMFLFAGDKVEKKFKIALGGKSTGHKQQEGDKRTPEGIYSLDYKKADSAFHRAIHISYPNEQDILSAKKRGVSPGGNIMIHGQKNGLGWLSILTQLFDWTNGCIALTNSDMDQVWNLVKEGTLIEIRP